MKASPTKNSNRAASPKMLQHGLKWMKWRTASFQLVNILWESKLATSWLHVLDLGGLNPGYVPFMLTPATLQTEVADILSITYYHNEVIDYQYQQPDLNLSAYQPFSHIGATVPRSSSHVLLHLTQAFSSGRSFRQAWPRAFQANYGNKNRQNVLYHSMLP